MATTLRPFKAGDLEALYAICLETGYEGGDAAHLYSDPHLIGEIYSAPYGLIKGGLVFVAVEGDEVVGYAAGAVDTALFEARLEREWWPEVRRRHPYPGSDPQPDWTWDQRRAFQIYHPGRTPSDIVEVYPSHVHMNLRAGARGRGVGLRLLDVWLKAARKAGVESCHVGVNPANQGGLAFWRKCNFEVIVRPSRKPGRTLWMGRGLEPGGAHQPLASTKAGS